MIFMLCVECGSEMRFTDEVISEDYDGTAIAVDGIGHWVCDNCGCTLIEADEAERLSEALTAYAEDTAKYV